MTHDLVAIQKRIALGEEQALAELCRLLQTKLQQFAVTLVRSREQAEEIVEDVLVKLWYNRQNIAAIENLTVYLYVAVKNQSLNALSHKAKELITASYDQLDINLTHTAVSPHDLLVTAEMMQRMQQAVDALPPRCKMIFKLVREDGLAYKEVADILNISINTIDAQMAIAVKRIAAAVAVQKPSFRNPFLS
ncbi:RNA polymerase sigma-70 factor, ECF subfamily [Filimonas lacunae]|uniref:RNA polymerase sigma-70 factor, ECF subfamily n=1 Tax=Filimonas lacunae TaxID=477680 RepID=A0A173M9W2_9BACT|nr:RNA polymerase sigma-70 factor [Filimonas lacunae]BAV04326.1 RNA polymerase ECF-type sigma factor [Filimonas lacunae]SIT31032.1 RNA polymerase sigma-70 factor, ECF subfamily [Filimonas lacunae]